MNHPTNPAVVQPGIFPANERCCVPAVRRGFTLLEVLIASTLGMLVMALAISSYQNSQRQIRHAEALLRMHRVAGDVAELWERDASALLQHVACNSTTTYGGAGGAKTLVQFTGMRTVPPGTELYDYPYDTDLAWVRWEWNAASHRLRRAMSPPPHWVPWYPYTHFLPCHDGGLGDYPLLGMRANPVRTYAEFTSGFKSWDSIAPFSTLSTRIYDKLFLTGVDVDGVTRTYAGIGGEMNGNAIDHTPNGDLVNYSEWGAFSGWQGESAKWYSPNIPWSGYKYMSPATWATMLVNDPSRTLADDVSDCSITLITRGGTIYADGGAGLNQSIDGEQQTGIDSGSSTRAARPERMRLSFTLTDRSTGLRQSFTFSAKAP